MILPLCFSPVCVLSFSCPKCLLVKSMCSTFHNLTVSSHVFFHVGFSHKSPYFHWPQGPPFSETEAGTPCVHEGEQDSFSLHQPDQKELLTLSHLNPSWSHTKGPLHKFLSPTPTPTCSMREVGTLFSSGWTFEGPFPLFPSTLRGFMKTMSKACHSVWIHLFQTACPCSSAVMQTWECPHHSRGWAPYWGSPGIYSLYSKSFPRIIETLEVQIIAISEITIFFADSLTQFCLSKLSIMSHFTKSVVNWFSETELVASIV